MQFYGIINLHMLISVLSLFLIVLKITNSFFFSDKVEEAENVKSAEEIEASIIMKLRLTNHICKASCQFSHLSSLFRFLHPFHWCPGSN